MEIILGIFIIWLATVIPSVYLEIKNGGMIYKFAAEEGYKIDNEKVNCFSFKHVLKPGKNLVVAFERAINFNNKSWRYVDLIRAKGALIQMTKEEEVIYRKKPTAFTAFRISKNLNFYNEDSNKQRICFYKENKRNVIYYVEENGYYFITKIEGPVANLSLLEQRSILIQALNKAKEKAIERKTQEESIKRMLDERSIPLNTTEERHYTKEDNLKLTRKKRDY